MTIPGARLIVPVLIGAVFASCAQMHEVSRPATGTVVNSRTHYVIEGRLYSRVSFVRDTLVCAQVHPLMKNGIVGQNPTGSTDQDAKADSSRAGRLMLEPSFRFQHADTIRIPTTSIASINRSELNPMYLFGWFLAGMLALVVLGTLIYDTSSYLHIDI